MKQAKKPCRLTAMVLAVSCVVSVMAFGTGNQSVSAASQTDLIKNGSVVYVKNVRSGRYLDVAGATAKNGANVLQYSFHGKKNQQWKLVSTGDGTYKIASMLGTGKYVLDIASGSTGNGANLIIWNDTAKDNQRFSLQSATSNSTKILTKKTGYKKSIAVKNASKSNKANVLQWTYNASGNDQWVLEAVKAAPPASSAPVKPPTSSAPVSPPASSAPVNPPASSAPVVPPTSTDPIKPPSQIPPGSMSDLEKEVIYWVNIERAKEGLNALQGSDSLASVARLKSIDITVNNYFDHQSPTYGSPFDMMRQFGISYRAAGENLAQGYPTPKEVVAAWMDSPGHRRNIMYPTFTTIGVGYDATKHTWTQMFIG